MKRCVKAGCRRRRQRPRNGWVFAACPAHTLDALHAFGSIGHQGIPESTRLDLDPSPRAPRGALLAPPPA